MASFAAEDIVEAVQLNDTAFKTRVADNTVNRLDVPGTYDFNIGRHRFIEDLNTGGGTFIQDDETTDRLLDLPSTFQIVTAPGEEHVFSGRERIRYVPNYELLIGAATWAENELQDGQHFAVEFSNDAADNGYRYHYEGTPSGVQLTVEQFRGSTTPVDSFVVDLSKIPQFDITRPRTNRAFLNWYGAGLCRYTFSYPVTNDAGDIIAQLNPTLGRTANLNGVATDEINLRVQCRTWAEAGSSEFTTNVCSLGALIRGNAVEVDREKPAVFWDIGGSISQYPTDNVGAAIAGRIDPNRPEVFVSMSPPIFRPAGTSVHMEMGVYAIHRDNPDLTVNFDDPGDDGTDEGPSPAAQARASSDVMQYTRDVTAIPTATDVRADGSTGLVPDGRHLTTTLADSGGGTGGGSTTAGELQSVKRIVFDDDVLIFLPRTDPNGGTTNGRIRWLKTLFEQDW